MEICKEMMITTSVNTPSLILEKMKDELNSITLEE